jgi:hypothetical protein
VSVVGQIDIVAVAQGRIVVWPKLISAGDQRGQAIEVADVIACTPARCWSSTPPAR